MVLSDTAQMPEILDLRRSFLPFEDLDVRCPTGLQTQNRPLWRKRKQPRRAVSMHTSESRTRSVFR